MKRLLTCLITLLACAQMNAQQHVSNGSTSSSSSTSTINSDFNAGTNLISLGVGFGGAYSDLDGYGAGFTQTPNIILAYDRGIVVAGPGVISVGALFSYKGAGYSYTDPYSSYNFDYKWTYIIIGIRGAYHWNFTNNRHCDPYAGIMISYNDLNFSYTTNAPIVAGYSYAYAITGGPSYVGFSGYVGFRYFVTNHVGFYGELGYGYTIFAVGANLKF